ncbi:MAG: homoserine kinase [Anaerolineae bacterium]|nr:homoserine kinase [Anaerolineae bacterium]
MPRFTVNVPATTANLGPGFDCLGLALDWWNTITVEPARKFSARLRGDSEGLPADETNMVVEHIRILYKHLGAPMPPLRVTMTNRIPIGKGFGSSAAALVGGLAAGNALAGTPLSAQELLELANELEGHPDNVSAAIFGGFTISAFDGGRVVCATVEPAANWRAVAYIPDHALATKKARKVLPDRITRADAVFNIGRAALLAYAFTTQRASFLKIGTEDRLHQPYRVPLVKGMPEMLDAACAAGANGAALSGAGPSLIAFATSTANALQIQKAFAETARKLKLVGETRILKLSARGTFVARS